jgi:LAO/AO transport system kinase
MSALADAIVAGEPRAIARAITVVERGGPSAAVLLEAVRDRVGRALVVGVTGPPGAGKSTLVDRLIALWRERGRRVGVLAVDPSSPFSGGALLGDRVRMQGHATDAGVFIRSLATRGASGGLSRAARDAVQVLDAAGFDPVVVETVGVGQAEVDVARLADVVLVVTVPGTGDDVQALKAGLMEAGDLFVVNKADREGADGAAAAIEGMLALDEGRGRVWQPLVIRTVATSGEGVEALVDLIARFAQEAGDLVAARRRARLAGESMRPGALRLDHVGIAVHTADRVLDFLRDTLRLEASAPEDVPGSGVRVRFAEAPGVAVEIVEAAAPDSPIARFLARRGPGLHHVAFRVPDVTEALARLRARGVRLIDEAPRPGARGTRIAFVHPSSAGGMLVELVERRETG